MLHFFGKTYRIPHRTSDVLNSTAFPSSHRTANPQIEKMRPVLKMPSGPRFVRSGRPPLFGGGDCAAESHACAHAGPNFFGALWKWHCGGAGAPAPARRWRIVHAASCDGETVLNPPPSIPRRSPRSNQNRLVGSRFSARLCVKMETAGVRGRQPPRDGGGYLTLRNVIYICF